MKRTIFSFISIIIFLALPASGSMVSGTISDSATGLPISNVKAILSQLQGEREEIIDTSVTGATGSFSFTFSGPTGSGFYIRTIATQHYFKSTHIRAITIDDTITCNIKLRKILTKVSKTNLYKASQNITIRTVKSRLYISGIKTEAMVDIYNLNGKLIFRAILPSGVSMVSIPGGILYTGSYHVSIRTKDRLVRGISLVSCVP